MRNKMKIQLFIIDNLIWVILLVFMLINAIFTPNFFTYNNLVNILYHSSILSLLILAQGFVLMSHHLDLSTESVLAFSPTIAVLLATSWLPFGLDPYTTMIITIIIGGSIGLLNGYLIAVVGINPLLLTISMMIILRGLVTYLIPFPIYPLPDAMVFMGQGRIFGNIPIAIIFMIIIFTIAHFVLQKTPFGRRFIATGGNLRASIVAGINTKKMIIFAFVMSGVLSAFAGLVAVGRQASVQNSVGEGMVLLSFAGAILGGVSLEGGKGTAFGMLGGAILLGMFSNALNMIGINISLLYASKGALILLAIIIDRIKVRVRSNLLYREQVKKLLH
jgi:simple sugar transport system permease protein/ribose transport system permease protein